jgi:acetyltransferase-like isoleucine patch superfamily enzyme
MALLGKLFLFCYIAFGRVRNKCFSLLISGAFGAFGKKSILTCPIRLVGEKRIEIGDNVFIGAECWLQSLDDGENRAIALSIGSGSTIEGACVISALRSVVLEEEVLLARNVYISDHMHKYGQRGVPIRSQGLDKIRPVRIMRGAWLGQNVVICPGVTIGVGSVVGANSVVRTDVPDFCVAVGSPARVVKVMTFEDECSDG